MIIKLNGTPANEQQLLDFREALGAASETVVVEQGEALATLESNLTGLGTDLETSQGQITTIQGQIATLQNTVTGLQNAPLAAAVSPWIILTNVSALVFNKRYITTGYWTGTFTMPAAPPLGTEIVIADGQTSWGDYARALAGNGNAINGQFVDFALNVSGGCVTCVFIGGTIGWNVSNK